MLHFPLSPADFRTTHFEQGPLLCKAALSEPGFSWADLDAVLNRLEPDERNLQLFNHGLVPQAHYARDVVEMGRPRRRLEHAAFYEQLRAGSTLVLNRFEDHASLGEHLCADIARFTGLQTSANTYVSYGGQGTFGKHWDTHDVFAVQLLGRKRWQIYAPTFPLPLSHQTSESAPRDGIGSPAMDIVLEPGDLLYVPRGWWHSVIPFDAGSCHVSIGTYAATTRDYLMWLASQFFAQEAGVRRAFPPPLERRAELADTLQRFKEIALDPGAWRRFEMEMQAREKHHGAINLDAQLTATQLSGAVVLRLVSLAPPFENRTIIVNGKVLRLEALSAAIVAALRSSAVLTFDALRERIGSVPRDALTAALLELARHEVISIEQSKPR